MPVCVSSKKFAELNQIIDKSSNGVDKDIAKALSWQRFR